MNQEQPTALVTGASSGIGQWIAERLRERGFRVWALARWRQGVPEAAEDWRPKVLDLGQMEEVVRVVPECLEEAGRLGCLVNAAGFGRFPPHRDLDCREMDEMVRVNMTTPMVLCRLALPWLERSEGLVVNVSSITARHLGKRGAAYAATKAGLLHFSRNLFEEVRKSGVRVTTLLPDLTRTAFYDELPFAPADEPGAAIGRETIVAAINQILDAPAGTVVEEITLRPQRLLLDKRNPRSRP